MNADAVRAAVVDAVLAVAPEADFAQLDPKRSLRAQLELDSFDFLNVLIDLDTRLGVTIPESDYAQVDGLDALVGYLAARVGPDR